MTGEVDISRLGFEPLGTRYDGGFVEIVNAAATELRRDVEFRNWGPYLPWGTRLEAEGSIETPAIVKAFNDISRHSFLPDEVKRDSGIDLPLEVGYGQPISAPTGVGKMLELLDLQEGQRVWDVGSCTGYSTTLLAAIVGEKGRVIGTELVPELTQMGQHNLARYPFPWAEIKQASDTLESPDRERFDRILVSAATPIEKLPELIDQLEDGGIMVVPVWKEYLEANSHRTEVCAIVRSGDDFDIIGELSGYSFVPLLSNVDTVMVDMVKKGAQLRAT